MSKTIDKTKHTPSLYVVATPIGNLGDISLRAIQVLSEAKYIACEDTRTIKPLLQKYNIDTGKTFSYHKFNETKSSDYIVQLIQTQHCDIALTSDAGTPCINDPGALAVRAAREHGIPTIAIPGASATIACMSISGLTGEWAFLGFVPKENKKLRQVVDKINNSQMQHYVFFESPKRILDTLKLLDTQFKDASYFVCKELTKIYEYSTQGSFRQVYDDIEINTVAEKGEYVLVISPNANHLQSSVKLEMSPQALIVQAMAEGKSIKDAIILLTKSTPYSKNQLYNASLQLKKWFASPEICN